VRFGLLSTARINDAVLGGAAESSEVSIVAVASRDDARARAYAREKGLEHAFGSYEAMLESDAIDAVYIGLPNGLHFEWAVKALQAGKHVVVEKPFSSHVKEVERAFDVADQHGLVLSEAFMWRYSDQTRKMVELSQQIGDLRLVRASFSFTIGDDGNVRWDPALEGGALMDVGCYCISAARLLLGEPTGIAGFGIDRGGVDSRFGGVLRFGNEALAVFDCGFDLPNRNQIEVVGADGVLVLDDPWHAKNPGIDVHRDGRVERVEVPRVNSYCRELEEVAAAARDGRLAELSRDDAIGQAQVLEALLG
jgi:xylose dehydrogenase (NAD/NADP)